MNPAPITGILFGFTLIVFRNKICMFLQKFYERFPKYEDGEKTFKFKYTIRPIFITTLGCLILIFSIIGLLQVVRS